MSTAASSSPSSTSSSSVPERDATARLSACSTTRRYASSVSTARSSAIAPRSTISTTSWSTTATARSRPRAPHSTSAQPARVTTISCSCTRTSCCTRSRRSSARRRCWTPITASGSREAFGVERGGRFVGRVRDRVVLIGERAAGPRRRRCRRRGALHRAAPRLRPRTAVRGAEVRLARVRRRIRPPPAPAWAARVRGRRTAHPQQPLHQHRGVSDGACRAQARVPRRVAGPHAEPDSSPDARSPPPRRVDPAARLAPSLAARVRFRARRTPCPEGARCVLGDIRWCIDDLLAGGADPLLVVNLDRERTFVDDRPNPLVLKRLDTRCT